MQKIRSVLGFRFVLFFVLFSPLKSFAAGEKAGAPRVSVTRFSQEAMKIVESCNPYVYSQQGQLQTVLESELAKNGLRILERKTIRDIHENEFELPNLDQRSVPERKRFLSAQYTVTGAIVEQGICEERDGSGLRLGGLVSLLGGPSTDLEVRRSKSISKVKLIAKLISTKTGEVIDTFTAGSEVVDSTYGVSGGIAGIGGNHKGKKYPPLERASNEALADLAKQISAAIFERR